MRFLHPFQCNISRSPAIVETSPSSASSFLSRFSDYEVRQRLDAEWVFLKDLTLASYKYPILPPKTNWCCDGPPFRVAFSRIANEWERKNFAADPSGAIVSTQIEVRSGAPFRWWSDEKQRHIMVADGSSLVDILGKEDKQTKWISAVGQYYGMILDAKRGKYLPKSNFGHVMVEIVHVFESGGETIIVLAFLDWFEKTLREKHSLWAECLCPRRDASVTPSSATT